MANDLAERPAERPAALDKAGPMLLAVHGYGDVPELDPQAVSERITRELLEAESPDELLQAGSTVSFDELIGVPVEVRSAVLQRSTKAGEGPPVYMLLEAIRGDNGDDVIISTSGINVMIRVAIASDRDWLPITFKVRKTDEPTQRGFNPYIVESV